MKDEKNSTQASADTTEDVGTTEERIAEKRRAALAKLTKLGLTGAAASIAILAMTRQAAASPE